MTIINCDCPLNIKHCSKNIVSAVLVDKKKTDLDEYLIITVESEFAYPDLWIDDIGATVHMTPFKAKFINVKSQITSNVIMMRSGCQELFTVSFEVFRLVKGKNDDKLVRI
jgi:hypothetical protein